MRDLTFLIVLSLFSVLGFIFSQPFSLLKPYIVPLLMVIMLSMGLTLTAEDFKRIFRKPHRILYGSLLQFTIMPLSGFFLSKVFGLGQDLEVGVVLVGSAPGGTASNLITYISGGSLPYSISMTTLSTMISPLVTPLWTWALVGKAVHVPFLGIALTTLKIVIAPVLMGMVLRRVARSVVSKLEPTLPYVSIFSISLIIGVIFALNRDKFADLSLTITMMVLIHNLTGFLLGFLFGKIAGLDNKLAKTLSIEVGMQNSGLSTVLALKFFSSLSALPSALFSLSQNLLGVLIAIVFRRI